MWNVRPIYLILYDMRNHCNRKISFYGLSMEWRTLVNKNHKGRTKSATFVPLNGLPFSLTKNK